tara:strand:+ start:996 stop:1478 length:483 start_codon:yes stop_codon:yes gene_type:complete
MLKKSQILFYPFIIIISIFVILSTLYIEHILLVPACKLCLYQRIPYLISIVICFFGFFFSENKIWLYLLIITFFSSVALSGYHLGIEHNIFNEFSGCTNESLKTTDKIKLLESLNQYLPDCKDVNFRVFGFSLATINFIISIALAIIIIKYFRDEKNVKN